MADFPVTWVVQGGGPCEGSYWGKWPKDQWNGVTVNGVTYNL